MNRGDASSPLWRAMLAAVLAFLLGMAVTLAVTKALSTSIRAETQARFDGAVRRLENDVVRRINPAAYGLRGVTATYAAHGSMTTEQFRDWVAARDLPREFPGVRGFGLISRVERADLEAFVEKRREVDPHFKVTTGGGAPELFIVTELEPRAPNSQAIGFDVGQEPARRRGIERAIASGTIALTDRIALLQDNGRRSGWLMVQPVYGKGPHPLTDKERRRALVGLLYAPMVAAEVLGGVRENYGTQLAFRLYDGTVAEGMQIFDSVDDPKEGMYTGVRGGWDERQLRTSRLFRVGGQDLTLDVASTGELESDASESVPVKVAVAGMLLSATLSLAVWLLANGRRRAEVMAATMTEDLSRSERSLRSSEAFLEQAQRIANVGGWEVDLEKLAVRMSAELLRLFDLPPDARPTIDEFIGFFAPQSQEDIENATREAVRDGKPWDLELSLVSAKGASRWVRTVGHVDRDGSRSLRLIGTLQDITGRKKAEDALLASEQRMRLVTDNLPGRVGYWSREQVCMFANRVFGETFGMTREQIVGQRLLDVLGPARYEEYRADIEAALAGSPRVLEREEPFPDGSVRTMLVHYIPDTREGEVQGFFVLGLDVTELKKAREEARHASAAKGQFLANTSHELRTPMNAIIGMLTLLRESRLDAKQADWVDKADGAARSLLGLLNDILDFSKVEAGKLVLDPRPFRLAALLRDVQVILAANARSDAVTIRLDVDAAVPPVLVADDMRLRQVLINLGGNAVKFTEHGEVVVCVRLAGRDGGRARVEFSVKDTGIGIAPEQRSRIFEGFTQAEASTMRKYGGTGLGLAISQRLVSLMNGRLELESEVGEGSRFFFTIDMPVGALADEAPSASAPPRALLLAGIRILVAEDNRNNQQVARELLASRGAMVEIAEDGRKALDRVTSQPGDFDLILMDVQMPVMDGYAATRAIRAAGLRLPIVAMTANAMAGDREACVAAGMNDHVGKPFDIDELAATVRRHVVRPTAQPRGAAPPPTADADVDLPSALRRLGGSLPFYRQIYEAVRSDADKMLERLAQMAGETATEEAGEEAVRLFHTLKGLAGTIGATGFARAAAAGEAAVRAGDADGADHIITTRAAYENACEQLDSELARLG